MESKEQARAKERAGRLSYVVETEMDAFDKEITLSSGIKYDHRDTLKKINAHKRGKFYNCSDEDAIFWPLGIPRHSKFVAKIDLDTKHFAIEGKGDYNFWQSWAANARFQRSAREHGLAQTLDDIGDALGDFGSTAIKLVPEKDEEYSIEECDLMKLWFDTTIKSFKNETKIELHELEQHEVINKEGWKDTEKAWHEAETVGIGAEEGKSEKADFTDVITVKKKFFERVGWFNIAHYNNNLKKGEFVETPNTTKWRFMHTIHAGSGSNEVIVFAEEINPETEDIYFDLHISKYEDRWMRLGIYERLFPLQKLTNESVNYNKESQRISSLLLLRTRNKRLVGSNVLHKAVSGLITDSDLEQIGITNNFFGEFLNTMAAYEKEADDLCSVPDLSQLDNKTFRGMAAQINIANSPFKKMRDRVGADLSKILIERIIPPLMREWSKEKTMEISGFDADVRTFDLIAPVYELTNYISAEHKKGRNPSEEEKDNFLRKTYDKFERFGRKISFNEKFFNFKYGLAMNPTGETQNKEQQNDSFFNSIQWVLSNPAVTKIPAFRQYCENNGISPFHLTIKQQQEIQQGATEGGGRVPQEPVESMKKDKLSNAIDTET